MCHVGLKVNKGLVYLFLEKQALSSIQVGFGYQMSVLTLYGSFEFRDRQIILPLLS